ncbi:MAG: M28 family peptidase [Acidobacteria bacterium]|nr:M28 family peptidase [Acidobacteriota bacterium]MBI3656593.1 M28 family peptidase [Acidobacteriota bacterium]
MNKNGVAMRFCLSIPLLVWLAGLGLSLDVWAGSANLFSRRDPLIEKFVADISAERMQETVETLVGFNSRNSASAMDHPTQGVGAAARWIRAQFEEYSRAGGGRLKVDFDEFDQAVTRLKNQKLHFINVVATLPGRHPDRRIVVGGHYDSLVLARAPARPPSDAPPTRVDPNSFQPGANDDASGTAAVLELARVMSAYEFEATIIFIAFAGEELGLIGSRHWAKQAKQKGWIIEAMIANDIIGNIEGGNGLIDNGSMRVFSEGVPTAETAKEKEVRQAVGGEVDSPSRQWARYVKEKAEAYVPTMHIRLIFRRDRYRRGGDHIPFNEEGYAAVRFTEANENYTRQHERVREENGVRYGDVPEKVSFPYAAQVTRVNAAALASLALAPAPPADVAIWGAGQYDTTLRWTASSDDRIAGYNILLRDTEAPLWQRKIFLPKAALSVENGTITHRLKNITIDNYFFAVQAVDGKGNESLPIFPSPGDLRLLAPPSE